MLTPFLCGTGSFIHHHEEDQDDQTAWSSPKKSRKSSKHNNNPYSDRGLDKFSALVADLEQKRQQIYSQMGSHDISLVRFVYSSQSNDVVPIVVRLKDHKKQEKPKSGHTEENNTPVVDKLPVVEEATAAKEVNQPEDKTNKCIKIGRNLRLHRFRRPAYYMPVFMVLILVLLALVGRSVAILCTSIGWYLVPTLSSSKRPAAAKKKVYMRRFSDIKVRNDRAVNDMSPRKHGHRKSF